MNDDLQLGHMSDLLAERLGENIGSRWKIALGCSRTCHSRPRKRTLNCTGGSQNVLGSEAPNIEEFKQTWLRGVTIEKRGRKGGSLLGLSCGTRKMTLL